MKKQMLLFTVLSILSSTAFAGTAPVAAKIAPINSTTIGTINTSGGFLPTGEPAAAKTHCNGCAPHCTSNCSNGTIVNL